MAQSNKPVDGRTKNKGNFGTNGNLVRHPWAEARLYYVQGESNDDGGVTYPTMQQVANKFNIPVAQIRVRGAEEKWTKHREGAGEAAYKTALARTIVNRAEAIEQFDEMCQTLAQESLQIILDKIEAAEDLDEKYQIIKSVSRQVMEYQKVGRIALGVPTDIRQNLNAPTEEEPKATINLDDVKEDLRKNLLDMPLSEIRKQLGL